KKVVVPRVDLHPGIKVHVDRERLMKHAEPVLEHGVSVDRPAAGLRADPHLDGSLGVSGGQAASELGDHPRADTVESESVAATGTVDGADRLEGVDDLGLAANEYRRQEPPDA